MRRVVKTIRVALMGMRPRLRDILTDALSRAPDVDLIEWPTGSTSETVALASTHPDVMVYEGRDPLDFGQPSQLLRAVPGARVLVVATSGDHAALFELRPTRAVMRTVGIDQLVAAIRYGFDGIQPGVATEINSQGLG
jgi:DNA-binding NarL/FixJ family response regulator